MVFAPDMRLTDRYRLVAQIGTGGMSEVWRAFDELLSRPVAVKALASPLAADPALLAATWQEARAAARLTHPHVTQVYDYGEADLSPGAPVPYLVMELVDGQNLADRLAAGPLPWASAARVAAQVAAALAAAHNLAVVHQDVKPGNVMLTPNGAKVLDFGIAALSGARPEHDGDLLVGTPAYAAPERLRNVAADPAGDVYSLGALFYECLTGRAPLAVTTWKQAAAAHERPAPLAAPDVPGLPPELAALCLDCLSPDPRRRPAASDVAARLTVALGGPDAVSPALRASAGPAAAAHPPTLIDRSLAAPAGPSAAGQRPASGVPAPALPSTGGRISASAAVVHRAPVPAPGPEFDGSGDRPPRSPLAVAGVGGGIVAAGLVLVLAVAALWPDSARNPAAGTGSPTSPAATPSTERSASPPSRPRPTSGDGIVREFDLLLTEAVAAGELDEEVAQRLRDRLDELRVKLDDGKRKDLRQKVASLDDEIREGVEDEEIPSRLGGQLRSLLQPLRTGGGRDNRGW